MLSILILEKGYQGFIICSNLKEKDKMSCLSFLTSKAEVLQVPFAKEVYSAHWIQ